MPDHVWEAGSQGPRLYLYCTPMRFDESSLSPAVCLILQVSITALSICEVFPSHSANNSCSYFILFILGDIGEYIPHSHHISHPKFQAFPKKGLIHV